MSLAGESRGTPLWLRRGAGEIGSSARGLAGSDRQVARFLAAQGISRIGDFIALAALPFAVFSLGAGAAAAGALFTCQSVALLSFLLFGGAIGDRLPRRAVMVLADCIRLASHGAIAVMLICGVGSVWMLAPLMVASGIGSALFEPAAGGVMPQLVRSERLAAANALRNFVLSSAAVLGPLLAGALILGAGPGWAFALDSLSFAASALLLIGLSPREALAAEASESLLAQVGQGWREFRSHRWLCTVVAQFSVVNALGWAPFVVLGAAVAETDLGGAGAWGAILTLAGLGEIGGCLLALTARRSRSLALTSALVGVWAAPLALLALSAPPALLLVAVVPAGASLGLFASTWDTAVQINIREEQLSRISSFDALGSLAMLPLGYMLAGGAQATIGITPTLLGCAALVLLFSAGAAAMPSVRAVRLGGALANPSGPRPAAVGEQGALNLRPAAEGAR